MAEHKTEEQQLDPEESIEISTQLLRDRLAAELLTKIKSGSAEAFEYLVVRFIRGMGYGSELAEAGTTVVGGPGDGGIDAIVYEDRLGLDRIYLQAKRWEGSVGPSVVQAFAGALQGRNADRGVLITTSSFTKAAEDFVKNLSTRIILIDGPKLVNFMFDYNVGVTVKSTYAVKTIDLTFFEDLEG